MKKFFTLGMVFLAALGTGIGFAVTGALAGNAPPGPVCYHEPEPFLYCSSETGSPCLGPTDPPYKLYSCDGYTLRGTPCDCVLVGCCEDPLGGIS